MHSKPDEKLSSFPLYEKASCTILPQGFTLGDKWEIIRHIASGNKGEIYLARQLRLRRQVAIKVISPDFIKSLPDNPHELEIEKHRYRREVKIINKIHHPNVLQVLDNGSIYLDGIDIDYLVMEYVPGQTLRVTMPDEGFCGLRAGLMSWINDYFIPILNGVRSFHIAGVTHRDLNPENILLAGATPKITDFGLVRLDDLQKDPSLIEEAADSIKYIPREQYENYAKSDARADIYALGKILYEAVSGKMTDRSQAFIEVGLDPELHPAYGDSFYRKLSQLIKDATKENYDERLASVDEFKERLEAAIAGISLTHMPKAKSKKKLLTIIAAIILILAAALYYAKPFGSDNSSASKTDAQGEALPLKYDDGEGGSFELVPAGTASWKDDESKQEFSEKLDDFYFRTNLVTNAQYISFLNAHSLEIKIKENIVYFKNTSWVMLGEARAGYEPIVYKDKKFSLGKDIYASEKVVNTSAEGAFAYAEYQQQAIPSFAQWTRARSTGALQLSSSNGQSRLSGEWLSMKTKSLDETKDEVKLDVFPWAKKATSEEAVNSEAIKAFPDIGFRTIKIMEKETPAEGAAEGAAEGSAEGSAEGQNRPENK